MQALVTSLFSERETGGRGEVFLTLSLSLFLNSIPLVQHIHIRYIPSSFLPQISHFIFFPALISVLVWMVFFFQPHFEDFLSSHFFYHLSYLSISIFPSSHFHSRSAMSQDPYPRSSLLCMCMRRHAPPD